MRQSDFRVSSFEALDFLILPAFYVQGCDMSIYQSSVRFVFVALNGINAAVLAVSGLRERADDPIWAVVSVWFLTSIFILVVVRSWRSGIFFSDDALIFRTTFRTKRIAYARIDALEWSSFSTPPYAMTNIEAQRNGKTIARGPCFSLRDPREAAANSYTGARMRAMREELVLRCDG